MVATRVLGQRREPRAVPMRRRAESDAGPYLAVASLQALVAICGPANVAELLQRLAAEAPPPVRAVARAALRSHRAARQ